MKSFKIILTSVLILLTACSSIKYQAVHTKDYGYEYAHIEGNPLFKVSKFTKYEDEIRQLAKKGYKLTYNSTGDQFVVPSKNIILVRETDWTPLSVKIVGGSFKENLQDLNKYGDQGFELRSVDYYWGKKWAFYKPIDSNKQKKWEYKIINSCLIHDTVPNINSELEKGWQIALKDYESGNYCMLKREIGTDKKYLMSVNSDFIGLEDELTKISHDNWLLVARYYYSFDRKGILIKENK